MQSRPFITRLNNLHKLTKDDYILLLNSAYILQNHIHTHIKTENNTEANTENNTK